MVRSLDTDRYIPVDWDPSRTLSVGPPVVDAAEDALVLADTMPGQLPQASAHAVLEDELLLGETLAHGGSGWIRAADQRSLERGVVVKSLLPHRQTLSDTARLLREARIVGRLDHARIVPVYGIGATEQLGPFIVMKRIHGQAWQDRVANDGPLTPARLRQELPVLIDVCRALEFAHSRGVLHRDIKLDNIMVGEFGEVYLIDWGSAYSRTDDDASLAQQVVGTPSYLAPEQLDRDALTDERTDVFLLGATLHHLLTGRPRHVGSRVNRVLEQVRACEPAVYASRVPPALGLIANRACAKDPGHRYPSVAALREDLADYLTHEASLAIAREAEGERQTLDRMLGRAAGRGAVDAVAVQRQFAVCRFAYQQALREWGDNPEAWAGLRAVLETMTRFELERGNAVRAADLLAEVDQPDAELVAAVEAAKALLAERADAVDRVAELDAQARLHGNDWIRSITALVVGLVCLGVSVAVGPAYRAGQLDQYALAAMCLAGIAASGVWTLVFRKRLMDSARYVLFALAFWTLIGASVAMCLLGAAAGMTMAQTLVATCVIGVAVTTMMAVTIDRSMLIGVIATTGASFGVTYAPAAAPEIIGAGFMLTGLYLTYALRPRQEA